VATKKEQQVPKVRISGAPDNAESRERLRTLLEFWRLLARTKEQNNDGNIPKA
jgi:hypothetical protein